MSWPGVFADGFSRHLLLTVSLPGQSLFLKVWRAVTVAAVLFFVLFEEQHSHQNSRSTAVDPADQRCPSLICSSAVSGALGGKRLDAGR